MNQNLMLSLSDGKDMSQPTPIVDQLNLAMHYLEMAQLYSLCLANFRDALEEGNALREENIQLRISNAELTKRLMKLKEELCRLKIGEHKTVQLISSPKSVLDTPDCNSSHSQGGSEQQMHMESKEARELEVYNQGKLKTELCNKWEESGECLYGEKCRFAHGIGELRPIIRHPRYKTEACRMVLAGEPCPYGHRCHFQHILPRTSDLVYRQVIAQGQ